MMRWLRDRVMWLRHRLLCVHDWHFAVQLPHADGGTAAVWRCEHCNRHIILKSEG